MYHLRLDFYAPAAGNAGMKPANILLCIQCLGAERENEKVHWNKDIIYSGCPFLVITTLKGQMKETVTVKVAVICVWIVTEKKKVLNKGCIPATSQHSCRSDWDTWWCSLSYALIMILCPHLLAIFFPRFYRSQNQSHSRHLMVLCADVLCLWNSCTSCKVTAINSECAVST